MQQAEQNIQTWKQTHWMNEFAKTTKKQEEERKAKRQASLPGTFEQSPRIVEEYKKQELWKGIHSIAKKQFAACANRKKDLPPEAEQTEKREKATGFWSDASITEFVKQPWPFVDLPEKVCSLASHCHKRKQEGLPLTSAHERFYKHLVDVHCKKGKTLPKAHEQFLEGLKQGATIRYVNF